RPRAEPQGRARAEGRLDPDLDHQRPEAYRRAHLRRARQGPEAAGREVLMHFAKLRLSGFKSFVEQTELAIEPGLTGVVGPNGCGKSNLVEALRWVMGENRVKQMRGGEMDDVIFA